MRKRFSKLTKILLVSVLTFLNFAEPVLAAMPQKGEISNSTVVAGTRADGQLVDEGDIRIEKTLSATDEEGKYRITFNISSKDIKSETKKVPYIVVVFDTSGSMICGKDSNGNDTYSAETDRNSRKHYTAADGKSIYCYTSGFSGGASPSGLTKDKWEGAVNGAVDFSNTVLEKIPSAKLSLVTFASSASSATPFASQAFTAANFNHPVGGTDLGGAINTAKAALDNVTDPNAQKYIVVIGDGEPTYYNGKSSNNAVSSAINAAKTAKNAGITIHSIGYEVASGSTAYSTLNSISGTNIEGDTNNYYHNADTSGIASVLDTLANQITRTYAGYDATLQDTIGSEFTFVSSDDTKVENDGQTVNYPVGDIKEDGSISFSFDVVIDEDATTGWHDTNNYLNDGVKLTYKDAQGETHTISFTDSPKVYWVQKTYGYRVDYYKDMITEENYLGTAKGEAVKDAVITEEDVNKRLYLPSGYVYQEMNPTSIVIQKDTTKNVIRVLYVPRNDLSYVVNYYEEGTTNALATQKVVGSQTFGSSVTENAIDILGYKKLDPTTATITIKEDGNVINFYYNKRNDLSYVVNYYELGTTNKLADSKVVESQTFGSNVTEKAITIPGYNAVSPTTKTIMIQEEGNVINFYYTKKTDLSYTVNYLEEGTNTVLADAKVVGGQTFGSSVTENAITIVGYNKVDPTVSTITIQEDGNVINFYYNKKIDLSYTVNYLEEGTNTVLADAKVVGGQTFGSSVTENAIVISGYNAIDPTEETITIQEVGNVINFYYTKKTDLSYTVNYLEVGTNQKLADSKIVGGQTFGSDVTESAITITGYDVIDPTEVTITIAESENVINFYYDKKDNLNYVVNYYEEGTTKKLADSKVVGNQTFGSSVTENAITIPGYNAIDPTEATITIQEDGNVINFYYNKKSDLSYTVNYYEEGTTNKLADSKVVGGQTYLDTVTESAIDIVGYNKVAPTAVTIIIEEEGNVINFYYNKKTDLSYTVNYLEEGTNTVLADSKVVGGQTYLDTVTESAIEITGYKAIDPTEATITIQEDGNVINFYYNKRNDYAYTVEYYYDNVLDSSKTEVIGNQTYQDTANVTEEQIISNLKDGYNYVSNTGAIIIGNDENTIKVYYERRTDLSYRIEYYYDNELDESKTEIIEDQTFGDKVTISEDKITSNLKDGYQYDSNSGSIVIGLEENVIRVYYVKRSDLSYTVEYYYDGVLDDTKTEKYENIVFGTTITSYVDKVTEEYVLLTEENLPLVISSTEEDNVIRIYYEKKPTGGAFVEDDSNIPFTGITDNSMNIVILITMLIAVVVLKKKVTE